LGQACNTIAEEKQQSISELIKRYLDLIGVDGVDRVLSRTETAADGFAAGASRQDDPRLAAPGRSSGDQPPRLVENGGPLGPKPTDVNALAQLLQRQASSG